MLRLVVALFDPRLASFVGAALAGHPEMGPRLASICDRETRCTVTTTHAIDARHGGFVWRDAVAAGHLDPQRCRWHRRDAGPWSTSGPWGAMRGYTLPYLGCAPAWLLDVPAIGAWVVARRIASPRCQRIRRCASWSAY